MLKRRSKLETNFKEEVRKEAKYASRSEAWSRLEMYGKVRVGNLGFDLCAAPSITSTFVR